MLSIRSALCVLFACINVHALASQVQISSKAIGDISAGTQISLDVNLQATEAISATYLAIEFDPDLLVFVGADNLASNGSQFIVNANEATSSPIDVESVVECLSDISCNFKLVVKSDVRQAGHADERTTTLIRKSIGTRYRR